MPQIFGPFRDAVGSKILKWQKNYQMDFRNSDEALREVAGYKGRRRYGNGKARFAILNIIKLVKEKFRIPVIAYQVSGEYSLIVNGINKKIINKEIILENLISFKRAGANAIVSYYADKLDEIIK